MKIGPTASTSNQPNVRSLAHEAMTWYFSQIDERAPHADNVRTFLRAPLIALTLMILTNEDSHGDNSSPPQNTSEPDWKTYLEEANNQGKPYSDPKEYETLSKRSMARLEAFIVGVSLATPTSSADDAGNDDTKIKKSAVSSSPKKQATLSIIEGLAGFRPFENGKSSSLIRSISSSSSTVIRKRQQISENDMVTRIELYLRSLYRVKSLKQECVIALEPVRAVKARANAIVAAFIETVSTVRQQGPVLTRLLTCMTKEILAMDILSEELERVIRRVVSEYEHATSFASLAFLSSPENAAEQKLTPLILNYIRYLRLNWQNAEAACELEEMLRNSMDPQMRKTFKTVEFRSIGHLLEVCQSFRSELQQIQIGPSREFRSVVETNGGEDSGSTKDALRQAIRDINREVITINGHVLPPATSYEQLSHLLSQTLNSQTLTNSFATNKARRRKKNKKGRRLHAGEVSDMSETDTSLVSSGNETTNSAGVDSAAYTSDGQSATSYRSFRKSTIDYLSKRLFLAASRTGTGGDAFFVVRDLFGGEDVEVVSSSPPTLTGDFSRRRESIEIIVRLASITIRCHGSFDVYPKALVGSCEPLIQVHTTTSERISLKETRMTGVSQNKSDDSDEEGDHKVRMVVQELITEKSGWRTLSVRPALYEKIEVLTTPS